MDYRIEVDAWSDQTASVIRRYFGKPAAFTGPLDTPSLTSFEGRILNPGNFDRNLHSRGSLLGPSRAGYGVVELDNTDGGLDGMFDAVDGRRITIYQSVTGSGVYPDDWRLVLRGTMEGVERPLYRIRLLIRDRLAEILGKPLTLDRYDGSNILPDGVEGVAEDLKGKPKPVSYGMARNVTPPLVNRSKLTYQPATANAGAQTHSVENVYTQGATITAGTGHVTRASLQAATVTSGAADKYDGFVNDGAYFRTGSVSRDVTADIAEGASEADRTPAQIIRRLLAGPGGVSEADIDDASFSRLDSEVSHICGIWVGTQEARLGDAIAPVAQSAGAYLIPGRAGIFRVGRIGKPTGIAVADLTHSNILTTQAPIRIVDSADTDRSLPPWRVVVRYQRNYTVQDSSVIVGSVAENAARARFLRNEWREVTAEDKTRKTRNPLAPELVIETLLDTEAAAQAEADRWLALFSPRTVTLQLDLHMSAFPAVTSGGSTRLLDLGDEVRLTHPRFGLEDGVNFIIKGITEDHGEQIATLELWGEL